MSTGMQPIPVFRVPVFNNNINFNNLADEDPFAVPLKHEELEYELMAVNDGSKDNYRMMCFYEEVGFEYEIMKSVIK